jgi:hypothetical protein
MNKGDNIEVRQALVKMCVKNPAKGAEYIRNQADCLVNCVTPSEVMEALAGMLCVSKETIRRDFKNKK